ncbi:glycosyltransferase [Caenibius tardaugens]|nr:glycosyltransferase [Caenibius tardaugens]
MPDIAPMCHICIFIPSLRGGGAERVMVMLANGFAERGHRVDLVLTSAEGPYLSEVAKRVRIVDLGKRRVLASLLPLARYLRRERPDAMLSALNYANIIAILARKLARTHPRLVVSERSSLSRITPGMAYRIIRFLMGKLYPTADRVVAVSQDMAGELVSELSLPPDQVVAIPNPVDIASLQALSRDRPDHAWFEPGQPPVFLAVGRLDTIKDYPTLLAALSMLRKHREARLIILGEGAERANLEQIIARLDLMDAVDLAGFKDNPFGWMASCNAFVLSSRYEGFPNVLVQAMACGARVISTDCPTGPAEILEHGKWGQLVPVGNTEAMAMAMADTLDEAESRDTRRVVAKYRLDLITSKYERVLVPSLAQDVPTRK